MTTGLCFLCGSAADTAGTSSRDYSCNCEVCGSYYLTRSTAETIDRHFKYQKWAISTYSAIREREGNYVTINENEIVDIVRLAESHRTPEEQIDNFIRSLAYSQLQYDQSIRVPYSRYARYYLKSSGELKFILSFLRESRLANIIDYEKEFSISLTMEGWSYSRKIKSESAKTNKCFVAMWFEPKLEEVYRNAIVPAISDCGYLPIRVDGVEHNNKIDDQIIAEIKEASFVVADFSGNRGGVYFEAGFAAGLGIPVIWTCNREYLEGLHFDTRQYNHIVWDNPEQLRNLLQARIRATIGIS